jgi:ABC-type multidrug transport system fused ATPase/permease subunit
MQKKRSFFIRTVLIFKPFWGASFLILALLFLGQLLGALSPYLFGKSVDAVIGADARNTIIFLLLAFVLTIIQSNAFSWIREYFEITKLDDHLDQYFSSESLKKMLSFSVGQHINEHSGIRQSIVNRGQNALTDYMKNLLYAIAPGVLQIIVTLGLLAYLEWRIALTALTFIILYVWISVRRNNRYFSQLDTMRKKRQTQSKLQNEFFRNATLVIAEAREDEVVAEYNNSGKSLLDFANATWLSYVKSFYSERPLIIIGQFASLGLGTYLIFIGELSAGMFVTLTSWIGSMVFGNLIQIMSIQRRMLFQQVEIKKLYDLLDIVPDIDPNLEGKTVEPFQGKIEFKDVSFVYPYRHARSENLEEDDELDIGEKVEDEHAVLKTSLIIPAGAKVGFVGVSGSGKSTLVNLMRRYYDPTEGVILVDDVPLKDVNLHWFRQKIGNVEQKIELLDRSIRENILFGLPPGKAISESEIQASIKDASLGDFIAKLPEGINTIIGENGVKVSGGERQRIGIARALIKNPKILIFDEATSALDSVNEKLIHDAINRGSKGRTTIVIAHRLSTIMDADIIFVVDDGKIVASGTHEELQKKSKDYQKLIKHQVLAS